ncbi:MAG: hypothetical protein JWQ74_583 [Marmoricola sp.]|nr:hypothetical protein [Marmoricola sp.]
MHPGVPARRTSAAHGCGSAPVSDRLPQGASRTKRTVTVVRSDDFPAWLLGLVDDAAAFPPASAPLDRAVADHERHRSAAYAPLLGGFAISDVKVPDLIDVLDHRDADEVLAVNVVVTGGAGAIAPAVRWAARAPHLDLRSVELALRGEDLAQNAQRVLAALGDIEEDLTDVPIYVELPRWQDGPPRSWLTALDELAAGNLRAKFRTGGAHPYDVPEPEDLAACIEAALDRELPFRCTGGLGGAVVTTDPTAGHGFLNVLLATRASLDGEDVVGALQNPSAADLVAGADPDALARARRWFTGFGSADVLDAYDELVGVGLVTPG